MSTDPTGLNGNLLKGLPNRTYMNVRITREDWCSYEGKCLIEDVMINRDDLCDMCKYKKHVDIPTILFKKREEIDKLKGSII